MIQLDAEVLRRAMGIPLVRAQAWTAPLRETVTLYDITTPQRLAAFLATIGHESGDLVYTKEIWGPTPAQKRYEGRRDLGNTQAGDGKRFMGRGVIQTTGRANYGMTTDELATMVDGVPDFVAEPHRLEEKRWAALSAGAFWKRKRLNEYADAGEFLKLQIKVNGKNADGFPNGWQDRQDRHKRALAALGA